MNLLKDNWLPVRRKSGKQEDIVPWQLTDNIEADPVVKISSPRSDFNGALVQFLISLLQTAFAVKDDYEWIRLYDNPPSPQTLHEAIQEYAHAFNVDGDGPRFMQDFNLPEFWWRS